MLVEPAAQRQRCGPDGLAHHGRVDDLQPEIGQPNRPLCVLRLRRSGGGGGLSALQSREATGEERVREGFRPCCEHVGLRRRISCWAHGGRLCLREQQPHRVHVARGEGFLHWRAPPRYGAATTVATTTRELALGCKGRGRARASETKSQINNQTPDTLDRGLLTRSPSLYWSTLPLQLTLASRADMPRTTCAAAAAPIPRPAHSTPPRAAWRHAHAAASKWPPPL